MRTEPPDSPTHPSRATERVLDAWIEKKIGQSAAYEPPKSLQKLAVRHGKELGITVKFLFTTEWQVRMTTKRGTVIAAPTIAKQTCRRCQGAGIIPHILDGGGEPCSTCKGESVTVEQAWVNSLTELGLLA